MQIIDLPFQAFRIILRNIMAERSVNVSTLQENSLLKEPVFIARSFPRFPLSERCSNLLSLLLHSRRPVNLSSNTRSSNGNGNPFREVFCILHDEKLDGGSMGGTEMISLGSSSNMNRKIHTEFEPILNTMLSVLPSESGALLLYSLIQTHPSSIAQPTTVSGMYIHI